MPKIYQVPRNSANYVVRKGQGKVRWVTVPFLSIHVQDIGVFLLILTPLKLIGAQCRKSQARWQPFGFQRSLSHLLGQCCPVRSADPSVNCWLLGHGELSTAIANKHRYTYGATCQNNFVSVGYNKKVRLVFCTPVQILPFPSNYFDGVLWKCR